MYHSLGKGNSPDVQMNNSEKNLETHKAGAQSVTLTYIFIPPGRYLLGLKWQDNGCSCVASTATWTPLLEAQTFILPRLSYM